MFKFLRKIYTFIDNIYLIPLVIFALIVYGLVAFVEVSIDFREWYATSRVFVASSVMAFMIYMFKLKLKVKPV